MNADIMPDRPRTTIKDNKISVSDVKGNVAAGGAHATQTKGAGCLAVPDTHWRTRTAGQAPFSPQPG